MASQEGAVPGGIVTPNRVLIIEDEAKTADTISRYLQRAGYTSIVARDGRDGLHLARTWEPDLIVLDVMLPGLDGMAICARVREASTTPILILTARVQEDDRVAGLLSGADDYVSKPFSPRELVARVHAVLRRSALRDGRSPMRTQFGTLRLDPISRSATVGSHDLLLTPKEYGLLEALCSTPNLPWTRARLLERVFGWEYEGTERTVDTHVLNLRRKLATFSDAPQITTVFNVGYKLTVMP